MLRKVIALYLVFQLIFQGSLFFEVVSLLVRVVEVKEAWAGPICVQPEGAVKPAEFDPNTGYCVTPVLSESGQCPGFYVFKPELGACIANPICSGVEYWDINTKQCVSGGVGGGGSGDGFGLDPNKSYCAVDMNGDGDIGQDEIRECEKTAQGWLCPYGKRQCNPNYVNPCPSGYVFNSQTLKCERDPQIGTCSEQRRQYAQYRCDHFCYLIFGPSGSVYCGNSPVDTSYAPYYPICYCTPYTPPDYYCEMVPPWVSYYYETYYICSLNSNEYSSLTSCERACYACGSGERYNIATQKCERDPICEGVLTSQGCLTGYNCPLGNYPCQQVQGLWWCSSYNCINPSQIQDDEPDTIPFGYEDDGARDNEGNCLGELFIFNGKGMRCKLSGIQTGFQNCCDKNRGILQDNFGGMSALDIKHLVEGLYALYQVGKIAKYAYDIGRGALIRDYNTIDFFVLKDANNFKEVARFGINSPEAKALIEAEKLAGSSGEATSAALQTYLNPQTNPNVALAITKLAISQAINDPVLASLANLGATLVFAYYFPVLMNPITIALAVVEVFLALFSGSCDQQDIMTATLQKSGYCHYVGTKCLKKWPLAGCVQKAKVYCCFNSKLARIIHEQGRPQLDTFVSSGMWGSKDNPYCRGFTPDEFQALDFGKIDLSEYYGDILKNINQNIEGTINRTIQPTLDTLQKYGN